MPVKHSRIEDIDLSKAKIKCLVYGPWGSGKTWFCGTAPKPHFLCTEEGLLGLAVARVAGGVSTFSTFEEYLIALNDLELGRVPEFETICLDGLSELCYLVYMKVQKDIKRQTLRIQDWGLVTDNLRMAMHQLISLGTKYHILVTARSDIRKDEDTKFLEFGPDILGAYRKAGPGAFDMVLYTKQETLYKDGKQSPKWFMSTVDYQNFPAKDRTGTLDLEEPNDFPTVFKKFASAKRSAMIVNTVGVPTVSK